jgi:hypothetical protein
MDMAELLTPGKNPFFDHAASSCCWPGAAAGGGADFGAYRSPGAGPAAEQGMGPGTGNWGLLEAEDEAVAAALIAPAEDWLRTRA